MRAWRYPSEVALLAVVAMTILAVAPAGGAGIVLDGSMGRSGALVGPNYNITSDLGRQVGGNLFHSFQQFNLAPKEVATFSALTSSPPISNIIARVTGGSPSSLDGTLRSTISKANLYFLNPAGIMFGPNARLDISGSFHATTADYLKLGKDGRFDARTPEKSVLTSVSPSAFGFATAASAKILINNSRLAVPDGQTMSFIGGDITITNNDDLPVLKAPGGTINLVSVASSGEASILTPEGIDTSAFLKMGSIRIANLGVHKADASGDITVSSAKDAMGSGTVYISAGTFVADNGYIFSHTPDYIRIAGKSMVIDARDSIDLINGSWIRTDTLSSGNGGSITMTTSNLMVRDQSRISSDTSGSGSGGAIQVKKADTVTISNAGQISTKSSGPGDGGEITIDSRILTLSSGGKIQTNAIGTGGGGNITIRTSDKVDLLGGSLESSSGGDGKAGNILLTTPVLTMNNGSIATSTNNGDGGNVTINTPILALHNGSTIDSGTNGYGIGGTTIINARDSVLVDGSAISSGTSGAGNGGSVTLTTRALNITGGGEISAKSADTATGKAGDLNLTVSDTLAMNNGSIATSTANADGGNIKVYGPSQGWTFLGNSRITTTVSGGAGNGGDISLAMRALMLTNSKIIANANAGNGGNITLDILALIKSPDSAISASSRLGVSGTIYSSTPRYDPAQWADLPKTIVDTDRLTPKRCPVRVEESSSFTIEESFGAYVNPDRPIATQ